MNSEDSKVFDALAHENRRTLLDALFVQDGQTLGELCRLLPDLTRFGCMKHLQVLEDAHLITTQKVGREKIHYLNPIPIQQVYERWVSKYARPFAEMMTGLKDVLERQPVTERYEHVFEVYIRTTPERLWQALTDGEITKHYYVGSAVQATWEVGSHYQYPDPRGGVFVEGEVLEIDPLRRMVCTFRHLFSEGGDSYPTTRVVWEIEPVGSVCRLRLLHGGLIPDHPVTTETLAGWATILSGLKTLLETGTPLEIG